MDGVLVDGSGQPATVLCSDDATFGDPCLRVDIKDIAIDPDGTVWFVRDGLVGGGVFVIRP